MIRLQVADIGLNFLKAKSVSHIPALLIVQHWFYTVAAHCIAIL